MHVYIGNLSELEAYLAGTQTPVAFFGATGDSTVKKPRIDAATHTLQTIEYEHHEIHGGSHYFFYDRNLLSSAATIDYLITTPNTTSWAHLIYTLTGSAITQFDVFEGADRDGTAAQTIFNNDRNSTKTSGLTLHKATSGGTTDGTLIATRRSGAASQQSRSGSEKERTAEIILKQNTKYLIRITSGTDNNLTNINLAFYMHTNKAA